MNKFRNLYLVFAIVVVLSVMTAFAIAYVPQDQQGAQIVSEDDITANTQYVGDVVIQVLPYHSSGYRTIIKMYDRDTNIVCYFADESNMRCFDLSE